MTNFSVLGGFEEILFSIVPIFITCAFIYVFGTLLVHTIQGAVQWKKNNASPVLTVEATVVSKCTAVKRHPQQTEEIYHELSSTMYFVTFQFASGDRMQFQIRSTEYGMLAVQDFGKLTMQGTRFLGFERSRI